MSQPTHACPGCAAPGVPYQHLACRRCWWLLSTELRARLRQAWVLGDRDAHAEALLECITYYQGLHEEDARRAVGTRRIDNTATYEWTGTHWKLLTPRQLDEEAYERARHEPIVGPARRVEP